MKSFFYFNVLTVYAYAGMFGMENSIWLVLFFVALLSIFYYIFMKYNTSSKVTPLIFSDENRLINTPLDKMNFDSIKIRKQPFQVSRLLHSLTHKVSKHLKERKNTIYYDVDYEIGRYIIGDNHYTEKALEVLLGHAISVSNDGEIVLSLKRENNYLFFEIKNKYGYMSKNLFDMYTAESNNDDECKNTSPFVYVKKLAAKMGAEVISKNSQKSGIVYHFKIPFYPDLHDNNREKEIKKELEGKNALYVGTEDKHGMRNTKFITKTYGLKINTMNINIFETKKPDFNPYNIVFLQSKHLKKQHISYFKNIVKSNKNNLKIIVIHDLFDEKNKIGSSGEISDIELYQPITPGDIEEVLYQVYVLKNKSIQKINNINNFDVNKFRIIGKSTDIQVNNKFIGAHVAIVEDDPYDQKLLQHMLEDQNIKPFVLKDGMEMIKLLENKEIDLIFTNVNLSNMDGIAMTKKIRKNKIWEHIPIISVSNMSFDHQIKEMYIAGMNAFVLKPLLHSMDIFSALEKFLNLNEETIKRRLEAEVKTYEGNQNILDVHAALSVEKSELLYREKLYETIHKLENTEDKLKDMIYNHRFIALESFARDTLDLSEEIYALNMSNMLKELIHFVSTRQKRYLLDYIKLYQIHMKELLLEVEKYISYVNAQD